MPPKRARSRSDTLQPVATTKWKRSSTRSFRATDTSVVEEGVSSVVFVAQATDGTRIARKRISYSHGRKDLNRVEVMRMVACERNALQKLNQTKLLVPRMLGFRKCLDTQTCGGLGEVEYAHEIDMTLFEGKDLFFAVKQMHVLVLSKQVAYPTYAFHLFRMLLNVVKTLHVMHTELEIMHADVKPENIVLTHPLFETANAVLVDFGNSVSCHDKKEKRYKCGTLEYGAPELHLFPPDSNGCLAYDEKADVYSLGMTVMAALQLSNISTNHFKTWDMSSRDAFWKSSWKHLALVQMQNRKYLPATIATLLFNMLCMDPKERWDMDRVLSEWPVQD